MTKKIDLPLIGRSVTLVRWWMTYRIYRVEPGIVPLTMLGDVAYLVAVGVRERDTPLTGTLKVIQHDLVVLEADVDALVVPVKLDPGVDLQKAPGFLEVSGVDRWVDVILGAYRKEELP